MSTSLLWHKRNWHVCRGNYADSHKHTENLIALAKEAYQDCEVADILLDQAEFAYQQGILAEARSLVQGALTVSDQEGMPHFQARAMRLLCQLSPRFLPDPLCSAGLLHSSLKFLSYNYPAVLNRPKKGSANEDERGVAGDSQAGTYY